MIIKNVKRKVDNILVDGMISFSKNVLKTTYSEFNIKCFGNQGNSITDILLTSGIPDIEKVFNLKNLSIDRSMGIRL